MVIAAGRRLPLSPAALVREAFGKHLERSCLVATTTACSGAAFDLTYHVRLRGEDAALALVADLNGLEGVQGAELCPMWPSGAVSRHVDWPRGRKVISHANKLLLAAGLALAYSPGP